MRQRPRIVLGDPGRQPRPDPVGEPRLGVGLVDDRRQPTPRRQIGRQRHVPAEPDDHLAARAAIVSRACRTEVRRRRHASPTPVRAAAAAARAGSMSSSRSRARAPDPSRGPWRYRSPMMSVVGSRRNSSSARFRGRFDVAAGPAGGQDRADPSDVGLDRLCGLVAPMLFEPGGVPFGGPEATRWPRAAGRATIRRRTPWAAPRP